MSQEIKTQNIALSKLHLNTGQIKDVPKNPRFIKDKRFADLKKSIEDDPEMLNLRELVAYDNDGELVVILGNMRYRAMKELGFKEAPVKVLPTETDAKKLRAYIQKDNIAFGQNDWDLLGNEWDVAELEDFGLECDFLAGVEDVRSEDVRSEDVRSEDVQSNNLDEELPEELRGVDITPSELPKIEGSDETAMKRVIIVYPSEREQDVAMLLGLEKIDKVVYNIHEITGEDE